ncbi:hypothetical protein CAOG_001045 [Capsaspora owczarzaki ATCC 30864]|uniref:Transmembrane protein n=2 Tax=Capsaspora owczarzaki (strain ATCC 30864) TaxID=595528 RepID=A0A0D2WIH0_CAPO3|nr:hypothetical protein CAOG_001045 [Capsaspora owczarzaki ATCC 30864]
MTPLRTNLARSDTVKSLKHRSYFNVGLLFIVLVLLAPCQRALAHTHQLHHGAAASMQSKLDSAVDGAPLGAHRTLLSTLRVTIDRQDKLKAPQWCLLGVSERLPREVFVDLDENAILRSAGADESSLCGAPVMVADASYVDIEQPAYAVPDYQVASGSQAVVTCNELECELAVCLRRRLHLRYQQPNEGGFATAALSDEGVLISYCSWSSGIAAPTDAEIAEALQNYVSRNTTLPFVSTKVAMELHHEDAPGIVFRVPVGLTGHTDVVVIVTIGVSFICVVVLLFAMVGSTRVAKLHAN